MSLRGKEDERDMMIEISKLFIAFLMKNKMRHSQNICRDLKIHAQIFSHLYDYTEPFPSQIYLQDVPLV